MSSVILHISIEDDAWHSVSLLHTAHNFLYHALLLTPYASLLPIEVSLCCTNDDAIRSLNAHYRHIDKPTNVLAFPIQDIARVSSCSPLMLGDIVLSWTTLSREAQENALILEDHILHLLVHGFLHLLGYDHQEEAEAICMETLERACLDTWNPPLNQ